MGSNNNYCAHYTSNTSKNWIIHLRYTTGKAYIIFAPLKYWPRKVETNKLIHLI